MSVQVAMSKYRQFEQGISIATPLLPVRGFVVVRSHMWRVKSPVFTVRPKTLQSPRLEPPPNSSLVQAEIFRRLFRQIRGIDATRAAYIKEMRIITAEERARFKANAKIAKDAEKAHWEIDKAEMAKTRSKRPKIKKG